MFFTYLIPSARGWEQNKDRSVVCFITTTGAERHCHGQRVTTVTATTWEPGMGKPCAVSGAMIMCTFGLAPSTLTVVAPRPTVEGRPVATIADVAPGANIAPFGMCQSLANPTVAAATAAALGVLTPMPCVPVVPAPWITAGTADDGRRNSRPRGRRHLRVCVTADPFRCPCPAPSERRRPEMNNDRIQTYRNQTYSNQTYSQPIRT